MIIKVKYLKSFLGKSIGLLASGKAEPVLLKTRTGIHTFGMSFPIDILILDNHKTVVKLKENLNPNSLFFWNPVFETVIELPGGYIRKKGIEKGTKLEINYTETI